MQHNDSGTRAIRQFGTALMLSTKTAVCANNSQFVKEPSLIIFKFFAFFLINILLDFQTIKAPVALGWQ